MMGVPSLNDRTVAMLKPHLHRAPELGANIHQVFGCRIIDAGVKHRGSLAAGVLMARACLADLADVSLVPVEVAGSTLPGVAVSVHQPVAACMASQYAGWQISVEKYFAMGSGPMRAAYGKEALFDDIGFREKPRVAVGILETGQLPDENVVGHLAGKLRIAPEKITLLCARTASLAGGVQVVARSVETAMHKLHELKFPLARIVSGYGVAPVPPVAKDDMAAIGRTNDAVLYGGRVTLFVTGDDDAMRDVGARLPSSASPDYGKPFGEIFKQVNYDFYKIDPMLFSPAMVTLSNLDTGSCLRFGAVNDDVLAASFFTA